jgi:DNA-binding GntR family transcriptional regulator
MEASPAYRPNWFVRAPSPTVATDVFAHLRNLIIRGHWLPGKKLSENEVAREIGVSRTPVREAFIRLQGEGLVGVIPQVGTVVSPIRLAEVHDNQFLRETIECRTIGLAAERCSDREAAGLREHLARQRECLTPGHEGAFFDADDAMHRTLIEAAGRPSVWGVLRNTKAQLDRVRHLTAQDLAWMRRNIAEHEIIVDRVIARDALGAVEAMRNHLSNVFIAIERISREHPEFFIDPDLSR